MSSLHGAGAGGQRPALRPLLERFDARVAALAQRTRGTAVEAPAHLLSSAADRSKLWLALAMVRAVVQGSTGRAAALRVALVVPTQVAVVELGIKRWVRRPRPDTGALPLRFRARRPPSSSFPSGHSASAATAAILLADGTSLGAPLGLLALAVAASRLQTGLHHGTDVGAGLLLGTAVGLVARRVWPLPHS